MITASVQQICPASVPGVFRNQLFEVCMATACVSSGTDSTSRTTIPRRPFGQAAETKRQIAFPSDSDSDLIIRIYTRLYESERVGNLAEATAREMQRRGRNVTAEAVELAIARDRDSWERQAVYLKLALQSALKEVGSVGRAAYKEVFVA